MLSVLIVVGVCSGIGVKGCKEPAEAVEHAEKTMPADPNDAPEGWMLIEEDILVDFVDEPGEKFHKARQSFLEKDYNAAAGEIRKAAAFMKLEAACATAEGKKALMTSVHELDKLANDIEKGTVTSADRLDEAFARAHHALARHHYLKALKYQAGNQSSKLGHSLKAAAVHLEHGFAWAGHKLEAATVTVIKDTFLVAGKLIEGTGWVGREVGRVIEKLGEEIEKLGRVIEPKKTERQTRSEQGTREQHDY